MPSRQFMAGAQQKKKKKKKKKEKKKALRKAYKIHNLCFSLTLAEVLVSLIPTLSPYLHNAAKKPLENI